MKLHLLSLSQVQVLGQYNIQRNIYKGTSDTRMKEIKIKKLKNNIDLAGTKLQILGHTI